MRLVSMQCAHVGPHVVEDLTIHSCPMSPTNPGKVRILKQCDAFDMSVTDSDDAWTYSPYCMQHVRAVSSVDKDGGFTCDVILDCGADTSALPLRFGQAGTECPTPSTSYVDAQGMPLSIQSTRLAHVQFGDVIFQSKVLIYYKEIGSFSSNPKILGWKFPVPRMGVIDHFFFFEEEPSFHVS